MKSCATGLSVRFFRVTIPFGRRAIGSWTGKTLISGRWAGKLNCGVTTESMLISAANYRCPPPFGVLPDHRPKGQVMHARRSFINPNASVLGFLLGAPTIAAPTLIRAGALLENLLRA
jgi:hypothetical protein